MTVEFWVELLKLGYYIQVSDCEFVFLEKDEYFVDNYHNRPSSFAPTTGIYYSYPPNKDKWLFLCYEQEFPKIVTFFLEFLDENMIRTVIKQTIKTKKDLMDEKNINNV